MSGPATWMSEISAIVVGGASAGEVGCRIVARRTNAWEMPHASVNVREWLRVLHRLPPGDPARALPMAEIHTQRISNVPNPNGDTPGRIILESSGHAEGPPSAVFGVPLPDDAQGQRPPGPAKPGPGGEQLGQPQTEPAPSGRAKTRAVEVERMRRMMREARQPRRNGPPPEQG